MAVVDLKFSREEFAGRLARVRARMAARGIDLLLVDGIEAMTWLSGFGIGDTMWRTAVVPLDGEPFLVVRALDTLPARERSWFGDIVGFTDWDDPVAFAVKEIERRGLLNGTIGLDYHSDSMSIGRFRHLRALLGREPVDFGPTFWELRWVKSPAEIALFRKAAEIVDAGIVAAVGAIKVGGFQRDIIRAVADKYLELGGDPGPVGPLTSGADWDSLHGHEHTHPLAEGAIVHIELVPRVAQYSSRIMRSCVVGKPSKAQADAARILIEIQDSQLAAMKPGARARDIDALVRQPLIKSGLRPTYDNITGYTLGVFPDCTQRVSDFTHIFTPTAEWVLEPGMVQHMYASAAGLAISETVVVTETGIERLTKSPRKLFSAG